MDLDGKEVKRHKAQSEDTAAILFTSGTTGTPKGVMLSHRNMVSDCYLAQGNMSLSPNDVFYAILPIHHSYTMMAVFFEAISVGASIVFGKKLIISQILKELKEGEVTMFLAVPMLFNKMIAALMNGVREKGIVLYGLIRFLMSVSGLLKKVFKVNVGKKMFGFLLKKLSLDKNRICISGGGPLPASTFKMFNQLGIDFVQGYGLTETSPITHLNPVEAYIETSVGKKIPQVEVKIVNPDSDGNGIIYIKGPMVMQGYYNNPEATAEVLEDGWLNTGDVGHQDARGYLYLTGRAKNIIVTEGGKNVFPEEIEDHFQLYNEIDTICVLGYLTDKKTKSEGIRALVYPDQKWPTRWPSSTAIRQSRRLRSASTRSSAR
jgi:long-chain acyl-CoA synthetase